MKPVFGQSLCTWMVGMRVYVVFCACVANIYVDD